MAYDSCTHPSLYLWTKGEKDGQVNENALIEFEGKMAARDKAQQAPLTLLDVTASHLAILVEHVL